MLTAASAAFKKRGFRSIGTSRAAFIKTLNVSLSPTARTGLRSLSQRDGSDSSSAFAA